MRLHHESCFDSEIAEHLGANGWLYVEGDYQAYDRARALFPADVLAWVQETQPEAWETLQKNHGEQVETLLGRTANGWKEWKSADGETLDQLKRVSVEELP